jgi:hypothetical protein
MQDRLQWYSSEGVVSDGVRYSFTFAIAFAALMAVVTERPEKRPAIWPPSN